MSAYKIPVPVNIPCSLISSNSPSILVSNCLQQGLKVFSKYKIRLYLSFVKRQTNSNSFSLQ